MPHTRHAMTYCSGKDPDGLEIVMILDVTGKLFQTRAAEYATRVKARDSTHQLKHLVLSREQYTKSYRSEHFKGQHIPSKL